MYIITQEIRLITLKQLFGPGSFAKICSYHKAILVTNEILNNALKLVYFFAGSVITNRMHTVRHLSARERIGQLFIYF